MLDPNKMIPPNPPEDQEGASPKALESSKERTHMSAKDLQIGSLVWELDDTHWEFPPDSSLDRRPLRRPMWRECTIVAETKKKWIAVRSDLVPKYNVQPRCVARYLREIPKNCRKSYYPAPPYTWRSQLFSIALTPRVVEDDVWVHENRGKVIQAVNKADNATLFKVAKVLGLKTPRTSLPPTENSTL